MSMLAWMAAVLLLILGSTGAFAQLASGTAAGASAATTAPAAPAPTSAPIMVGTQRLFDVGALPGQSAADRAAEVNRRIASFVNHPERIETVKEQPRGREWVLTMAGRDLLTVTPQDAADNLTTVPDLARSWGRELDQALSTVRAENQTFWLQIRGSIFQSAKNLARQGAAFIPRMISALLVLLITGLLAKADRWAVRRALRETPLDANTQQLVRTVTYYGIWTLGWIVALGTAGIQLTTIVAGLGVTTIALGFALKDLLSNFVSGFLILTTRPFNLGDQIALPNYEGTVERIELRATHLRTYDNRLVIIPNSDLYIATITNNTASPYRRQEFIVGVGYDVDLDRVAALAQQVAAGAPGVLPDPAPDTLIDQLANGSVNLNVRFYSDSRRGKSLIVASEVMRRIKAAFDQAGIAIYPTGPQVVQLEQAPTAGPSPSTDGAGGGAQAPPAPAPSTASAPSQATRGAGLDSAQPAAGSGGEATPPAEAGDGGEGH